MLGFYAVTLYVLSDLYNNDFSGLGEVSPTESTPSITKIKSMQEFEMIK
uniref:Uncharacterized protein n=1 Tax=Heterorhabditis bacteriophora TaxID=37862 RepID=A0A1I7W9V0_HETBA